MRIGREVMLEVTGRCDPCTHMEAVLGLGGYNAMRGHGGLKAGCGWGTIRVGDAVRCKPAAVKETRNQPL